MKLTIAAIGKQKQGAYRDLAQEYMRRLPWSVDIKELEEKRPLPPAKQMEEEGKLLLAAIPQGATVILLDERGKALTSPQFSQLLSTIQESGAPAAFVIGGAHGLAANIKARANHTICFGNMTWPHQMVRVMLLEQLYRAHTILTGHPYHKE